MKGRERCLGLLEVKSGQSFVPVCESAFSHNNAKVTCLELGCGFPKLYAGRRWGEHNSNLTWAPDFACKGDEKRLVDCPVDTFDDNKEECSQTYLQCTGTEL